MPTNRRLFLSTMLLLSLGVSAVTSGEAVEGDALRVQRIGTPLDDDIVSLFIPPTRSSNPIVATAANVYAYDSNSSDWSRAFQLPAGTGRVLAVRGYEKSSQVIYVAHRAGVARTRDGGGTWQNFVPDGFVPSAERFVSIAVDPLDRKTAILAVSDRMWITSDFGESWRTLGLPGDDTPVMAVEFAGADIPSLFVATPRTIYHSDNRGSSWTAPSQPAAGPGVMASSPAHLAALAGIESMSVWLRDASRPEYALRRPLALDAPVDEIATDCGGLGLLWFVGRNTLHVYDLSRDEDAPRPVYTGEAQIRNLEAHPRNYRAIYWTEGRQVFLAEDTSIVLESGLGQALTADSFAREEFAAVVASTPAAEDSRVEEVDLQLAAVLATQPSLAIAIDAALRYANYDSDEVKGWKKNARRRNLLPDVSVKTGSNEWPSDRSGLIRNVDRFGVPKFDDIRLDDRIADLSQFEIEVRWSLRDLLFDREEVSISREARERAAQRNELITQISTLYFDRVRLLMEQRTHGAAVESRDATDTLDHRIRIVEITQLLNELCGEKIF